MDKTDKSITEVSLKVFPASHSWIWIFSVVYLRSDIVSVWIGTHFCPWLHLPSRNQLFGASKILMLSPVTLERVKTFLLRGGHRTFSSNPKTEIICVAIISWEICLSYLGKVFGNLDVVFVHSTGTSYWPKTNLTFLHFLLLIKSNIFNSVNIFVSSTFIKKDYTVSVYLNCSISYMTYPQTSFPCQIFTLSTNYGLIGSFYLQFFSKISGWLSNYNNIDSWYNGL